MSHDELAALAARAYVYGFPLVFDLEQVDRFSRHGMGSLAAAPFNEFAHATQLAGPQDTFVSVNNDTVYSIAQLDVSGGPVRLRVPDVGEVVRPRVDELQPVSYTHLTLPTN